MAGWRCARSMPYSTLRRDQRQGITPLLRRPDLPIGLRLAGVCLRCIEEFAHIPAHTLQQGGYATRRRQFKNRCLAWRTRCGIARGRDINAARNILAEGDWVRMREPPRQWARRDPRGNARHSCRGGSERLVTRQMSPSLQRLACGHGHIRSLCAVGRGRAGYFWERLEESGREKQI